MKDETKDRMDGTATQFRQVAGLPERKNDKPHDPLEPSELRRHPEPEGGWGGHGEAEVDERAGAVDEKVVQEMQDAEEASAKSGQGTSGPKDAGTTTEATEEAMAASSKGRKKKAGNGKDKK